MAILSPDMGKKNLNEIIKKVQNGDKKSKVERYSYMGEQVINMSLVDAKSIVTKGELVQNLLSETQDSLPQEKAYSSVLSGLLGDMSYSKDELLVIRDVLIAPFVSDIYGGGSESDQGNKDNKVDEVIQELLQKDAGTLYKRLAIVTQEIESLLKHFPVEE